MRDQGVLSCGKHFPGYSRAAVDPHHELPVVARTRAELEEFEWKPFRALAPEIDSLMIGHANYPALDESGLPASLSSRVIRDLLRGEWGYQGAVISDDLDMGAIVGHYGLAELRHACGRGGQRSPVALPPPGTDSRRGKGAGFRLTRARRQMRKKTSCICARNSIRRTIFRSLAHAALDKKIYQLRVDTMGEEAAADRSIDDGKRSPVETF